MPDHTIEYMTPTADPTAVNLPEVHPTCEWNFGHGPEQCGKPASWALVNCCTTKFVCTPCLAAVTQRWAAIELRCKTCRVVFNPALKTVQRVIPL
ncbi:hypothetical protein Henu3_gp100 [Mycobacterium phage Henu3 PeY-2017]|nr:hypothetical protein Henu3_gp100 [Mycobacterium phage Henu3 PeY-2017]